MLWSPMSDFQDTAYGGIINFLPQYDGFDEFGNNDPDDHVFEVLDYIDELPDTNCYHGFAESSDDDVYSCAIDNPSRYPLIDVYYYIENRFNDAFNDMYADFDANIVKREFLIDKTQSSLQTGMYPWITRLRSEPSGLSQ